MLVLSRKEQEVLRIGSNIQVTVLGIHRGRVTLGISCPPEIPIRRAELDWVTPSTKQPPPTRRRHALAVAPR